MKLIEFQSTIVCNNLLMQNNNIKPPIIRRLPQGKAVPNRVPPFNILAIL